MTPNPPETPLEAPVPPPPKLKRKVNVPSKRRFPGIYSLMEIAKATGISYACLGMQVRRNHVEVHWPFEDRPQDPRYARLDRRNLGQLLLLRCVEPVYRTLGGKKFRRLSRGVVDSSLSPILVTDRDGILNLTIDVVALQRKVVAILREMDRLRAEGSA